MGIPAEITGDRKMDTEVATLAGAALATTGRALITRVDASTVNAVREAVATESPATTTARGRASSTGPSSSLPILRDVGDRGRRGLLT